MPVSNDNRQPTTEELNDVNQDTVQWAAKAKRVMNVDGTGTPISTTNPISVREQNTRRTTFEEFLVATRTSRFNFKPTWGVSELRDVVTETGTGASVGETGGEFKVSTGTATDNVAQIATKQRGQYQAGTQGEAGVGIRIPTTPTGTQFGEWGYFDDQNGFGFGVDVTGIYVFILESGTKTKTYQDNWNLDKVDGTGDSGVTLDLSDGNIFQIDFTWYGYGAIEFTLNTTAINRSVDLRVPLHAVTQTGEVSVVDPNQPVTVRAENGATSDTNFDVYVGGRNFCVVDGISEPQKRDVPIEVTGFSVTSTSFVAAAAIRKKTTFNGRNNSVNVRFRDVQVSTDNPVIINVDIGGSVTGGTWSSPSDVQSAETAIETNTTFTGDTAYTSAGKFLVSSDKNTPTNQAFTESVIVGDTETLIIYIKKTTNTDAVVDLIIDIEEEW
jgi:hypothetical protein